MRRNPPICLVQNAPVLFRIKSALGRVYTTRALAAPGRANIILTIFKNSIFESSPQVTYLDWINSVKNAEVKILTLGHLKGAQA
jgi:hypothetical protein